MSDYNGWTNRATWAVVLHVNNEQGSQEDMIEAVRDSLEEYSPDCAKCGAELLFFRGKWVHATDDDATDLTPACQAPDVEELALHVVETIKEKLAPYLDPRVYLDEIDDSISLAEWLDGPGMMLTDVGDPADINWLEIARSFVDDATEA